MAVQVRTPTANTVIGRFEDASCDIFQVVGPGGNVIASMTRDGLLNPTVVPVVQNSLLALSTNQPQSVSNIAVATSLYNLALYASSPGTGAPGSKLNLTLSWTQGEPRSVVLQLSGDVDSIQQENYVFLVRAGGSMTLTTSFTSTPFFYDIAAAIAILPTG
jgi:hypothetical protein